MASKVGFCNTCFDFDGDKHQLFVQLRVKPDHHGLLCLQLQLVLLLEDCHRAAVQVTNDKAVTAER